MSRLYLLHLGKTGGTAMKRVLRHQLGVPDTPYGRVYLPGHDMRLDQVPVGEKAIFCVRDPIARFASAYYSRLTKGQPRYYYPWYVPERLAFERFPTPQALADGLASSDDDTRSAAEAAMGVIRHLPRMSETLGTTSYLRTRLDDILYIGMQETLDADWQHLRRLLELPADAQLPSDPVAGHRGDPTANRKFDAMQEKALREWYAEDYDIVEFCQEVRSQRGWGLPIPDALPGMAPPGVREPAVLPQGPLTREGLHMLRQRVGEPRVMWVDLVTHHGSRQIGEIGFGNGENAQRLMAECPDIERYYLMDLPPVKASLNVQSTMFRHRTAVEATERYADKRVFRYGPTPDVIDEIPDGSLDFLYLGKSADHSLRGVTIDLVRGYPKVRDGGWIGGADFSRDIWREGSATEPTMVFPAVVHFAEAMGARLFALPYRQFLLEKGAPGGFEFIDIAGGYSDTGLAGQDPGTHPQDPPPVAMYRRVRQESRRVYRSLRRRMRRYGRLSR